MPEMDEATNARYLRIRKVVYEKGSRLRGSVTDDEIRADADWKSNHSHRADSKIRDVERTRISRKMATDGTQTAIDVLYLALLLHKSDPIEYIDQEIVGAHSDRITRTLLEDVREMVDATQKGGTIDASAGRSGVRR